MQSFSASQPNTWEPAWLHNDDAPVSMFVHTSPLTSYELTVALGMRADELDQNAAPRVPVTHPSMSSHAIAVAEMRAGVLPPMSVLRYEPSGTFQRKSVTHSLLFRRY